MQRFCFPSFGNITDFFQDKTFHYVSERFILSYSILTLGYETEHNSVVSYSPVHVVKQIDVDCTVIPHKGNIPFTHIGDKRKGIHRSLILAVALLLYITYVKKTGLRVYSIECFMINTCFNVYKY